MALVPALLWPWFPGGTPAVAEGHPAARIVLIGDSTVRNGTKGQQGWGDRLAEFVDPERASVLNRAIGGRSSRTFLGEGRWARVVEELRPGDFVLIQFGHNDGGPIEGTKARASLKGNGDDVREVGPGKEAVHSFGWYLRRYVADAKAKGATAIVLSPVPRNIWKADGTVARASDDYGRWASEAATRSGAPFVDLNGLVAARYEAMGREAVASKFFGADHTHTTPDGARFTAEVAAAALRGRDELGIAGLLRPPLDADRAPRPDRAAKDR